MALKYISAMWERYGLLAAWPPDTRLKLGDVGTLHDGAFRKVAHLSDETLQIPFRTEVSHAPGSVDLSSESQTALGMDASGEGVEVSFEFSGSGGFVVQADGSGGRRIKNLDAVGDAIIDRFYDGIWRPNWLVVDTVIGCERLTAAVSETSDASLEVSHAPEEAPGELPLLGFAAVTRKSGVALWHPTDATPLYLATRLESSWLHRVLRRLGLSAAHTEPVSIDAFADDETPATERVPIAALLSADDDP